MSQECLIRDCQKVRENLDYKVYKIKTEKLIYTPVFHMYIGTQTCLLLVFNKALITSHVIPSEKFFIRMKSSKMFCFMFIRENNQFEN